MHPYVHCSVIYNSQAMEASQVPINRQVDKKVAEHIYNGKLLILGHKKNEILLFGIGWIDLQRIMLSEIGQSEKDKYYMISLICGL